MHMQMLENKLQQHQQATFTNPQQQLQLPLPLLTQARLVMRMAQTSIVTQQAGSSLQEQKQQQQ
jgi:hypothetical protein